MIFSRLSQTSSTLCLLSLCASLAWTPAQAQNGDNSSNPYIVQNAVPASTGQTARRSASIRLRNLRPSLAAYWLNTASFAAPAELRLSQSFGASSRLSLPRLPGNGNGPVGLKLPEGIDSITPIDPSNELLVRGTEEGVEALQKLVPTFDVPLVQYEVEAQFIQIKRSNLAQLGVNFSGAQSTSPYEFGDVSSVPTDITNRINTLSKVNRAKILTAPRVLLIDGLEAELRQQIITPIEVSGLPAPTADISNGIATLSSVIGVHAAVLARPNHLLTLWLTPMLGTRSLAVETTVREDQSFAIQMSPPKDKQQLVVLVTPRRIRRASEE